MNWYLLQTKPNGHKTACEHLKRQGFDIFLPLFVRTTKKNGKFLDSTAPLFSGYLFMGTSNNPVPWKSINATRGVAKAVTLDGTFRPVDTHIIESLKLRCDRTGIMLKMDDILPGDRVKIERGPFADFICNVGEIADHRRVWLLIDLLQKQTKIKISINDLSKIA